MPWLNTLNRTNGLEGYLVGWLAIWLECNAVRSWMAYVGAVTYPVHPCLDNIHIWLGVSQID